MPPVTHRALAGVTRHVPGLRRLPMLKLLALGEIVLLAREHFVKLDPHERRRLAQLVRTGRGRRRNLNAREREELSQLIAKTQPGMFLGTAANKLSPVRIPDRVVRSFGGR